MKSRVTLYYKSLVNKEKNFVLDDGNGNSRLENYLNSLQKVVLEDFQYTKHQLSLSIKIDSNQTNLEMVDSKDLNYVKIQNYDGDVFEKSMFYFVISKVWRAKNTIELVLSMDTLNSFKFNEDYHINSKTLTKRMHKDRFDILIPQEIVWLLRTFPAGVTYQIDEDIVQNHVYTGSLNYKLSADDIVHELSCQFMYTGSNISRRILLHMAESTFNTIKTIRKNPNAIIVGLYDDTDEVYSFTFDGFYAKDFFTIDRLQELRKIDLKSEDISAPVYKKYEEVLKEQTGEFENSWVLYYKNKDNQDNSPVDCYLTSDLSLQFLTETGDNEITISDIDNNKTLFLYDGYQGQVNFDVDGETFAVYNQSGWGITDFVCLGFENRNGVLVFHHYIYRQQFLGADQTYHREIINPSQIIIKTPLEELKVRQVDSVETAYNMQNDNYPFLANKYNKTLVLQPLVTRELASSNTIDKTLSENLKIINVPYCPTQITKDENDKYIIGGMWTYDTTLKFFKLTDFSSKFENNITTNLNDILTIFPIRESVDTTSQRYLLDSKLYHSDYYRMKFVYDSFSRIFPLEQIDYTESFKLNPDDKFKFTFVMTRNIVSKFLFKFNYVYKSSNEDYPNVVAVARNNEEVLYNSSYLNYIRTGYNYDLKSKERQEVASGVGIGLNLAGFLASIGLSFVPGGQALGLTSAIGTGLGLVNQMVSLAKTTAQNEENIQKKLVETQREAVSVLNADDYDLLYAYTQNKAKLCLYEVSDNMKKVLDDLFYYCGYVVNEQMVPVINSRYWFNFVQASLIIDGSSNLTSEIEDDIKEKFEQGVTFLHYHNKFDFEQEMENWETSLLK